MSDLSREQKEALGRMIVEGLKAGDAEIVRGCFLRGADPDVLVQDGDSGVKKPVLHWIAAHFNAAAAKTIIDNGANLEVRDADGDTALMFAIRKSNPEAVEFLMKNGADPVAQNYAKAVALDLARGLRQDYDFYTTQRMKIIKALTKDYGFGEGKGAKPRASAPEAAAEKTEAPAPSAAGVVEEDIPVLKPLSLQHKKKGGGLGFNL